MKGLPRLLACALAFSIVAVDFAMADADCSRLGSLRSQNSNTKAKLTFVNKTPESRSIIWVDFNGNTQEYKSLQPGQKWTVNTFLTHPWLVTDGPGNCYGIYIASGSSRTINLTAYGNGGGD
jgi:hypothetical protein